MDVTIKKAKDILTKIFVSDSVLPVMIYSSPGVGKSSIVKQIAAENGFDFVDVRLSSMESSDVQGIPYVDSSDMKFSTPSWFPEDESKKTILFFDEISNASIDVQKAAYRLILDREIHNGKKLPENVKIVAAGNLKSDKTGAKDLVPALANRFGFHMDITPSLNDFKEYALKKNLDNRIVGFLDWKPDALYRFDPAKHEHSFPTPRSWEAMSNLINLGYSDDDLNYVVSGCVGEATSHEFISYLNYADKLPSMVDIMSGAINYEVDNSDRGVVFALTSSIISAARESIEDASKIKNLWKVVDQLDEEFIALIYRNMKMIDDKMMLFLIKTTMPTWKRVSKRII